MSMKYLAGMDIGSTTVKMVVMNEDGEAVFEAYRRHGAHTQETLASLLKEARDRLGSISLCCAMTGSGAMGISKSLGIPFVQEVVAVAGAMEKLEPAADVAIELGGEDAKIIYFRGGLEERMNGVCAGGTGAFIDQMAALMQTDAPGLNEAARQYRQIYPIAARCGVFAKSDIQPLINEGATRPDLAASIFQAVVNQTISGLACGKPIRGHVAFLGGPLHFLPELRQAFVRTLKLTEEETIVPEKAHLFAAIGAALEIRDAECIGIDAFIERMTTGVMMTWELRRMEPLFEDRESYYAFTARHDLAHLRRGDLRTYSGNCFLGVDAGSTTTKLALIGEDGQLLWSDYSGNQGQVLRTAMESLKRLRSIRPSTAHIVSACSTGYGEKLIQTAFDLPESEVETVAHATAAAFFEPDVDCVLDIGGQDMKYIHLRDGVVDQVLLNEACSSGCGSFLENFAGSLGYSAEDFSMLAVHSSSPVDLGTRCTVFMNSNVKQAQKEGASVEDIAAGLSYAVIRNALFKVIKLTDPSLMGDHVVVQGGTFESPAVLRAFEKISGKEVVRPDIAGTMGAFGAALLARKRWNGVPMPVSPDEMDDLTWETDSYHCQGCTNHCMITRTTFPGGRRHISGNRCEKGEGLEKKREDVPNLYAFKLRQMGRYRSLPMEQAPRGEIGIPRVLNIWENYPLWHTFFTQLGFRVRLSPVSSRSIYLLGMESIPSESECYPAKLSHGHVQWLIDHGVTTIFHPSVFYEYKENRGAGNQFNCPMVCAYPENLSNNVEDLVEGRVHYLHPFLSLASEKVLASELVRVCRDEWQIPESEVRRALGLAWAEQRRAKAEVREEGRKALEWMEAHGAKGILLCGRPYHVDPEIHHGIPEMIAGYGVAVLSEDSIPEDFQGVRPLRVNDQWVYHSRLYTAAQFALTRTDLEVVQLNSFGCGVDAVTTDQVSDILAQNGRMYTLLKIDEVNSLGAARIRIRSLLAAMNQPDRGGYMPVQPEPYRRVVFTKDMRGYTILCPRMSPVHFDLLEGVFRHWGMHLVMLRNDTRAAIDMGLKYVNNDACYPSIITVGQMMDAVLSGDYDRDHLALLMSQTGGCCRASNYVGMIRRALDRAGCGQIPVISANVNGMEKNPGISLSPGLVAALGRSVVLGDLMLRCMNRVRPYELNPGETERLHQKWNRIIMDDLCGKKRYSRHGYEDICRGLVQDFDRMPLRDEPRRPRVGIVGEILVKYMPLANNHLAERLESEGAEVCIPDLMDFLCYAAYNQDFKHDHLGKSGLYKLAGHAGLKLYAWLRAPARRALEESQRFEPWMELDEIAKLAEQVLSVGNQYGEGWFLTGEMAELIQSGYENIVCIQPFACLPNHVVGKGVIKEMKRLYPQANIVAVDFDPGASEVNQLNRIRLMLSTARKKVEAERKNLA